MEAEMIGWCSAGTLPCLGLEGMLRDNSEAWKVGVDRGLRRGERTSFTAEAKRREAEVNGPEPVAA